MEKKKNIWVGKIVVIVLIMYQSEVIMYFRP